MLDISPKTNLLEQKTYKYSLQDVAEPNLHREIYSYGTIPKVAFNPMPKRILLSEQKM